MDGGRPLPLFVLPMTLMPGEVTQLRVFEPRYKQMLDTCILDERPFGLVLNDPFQPVRGWDGPRTTGTLAHIEHHEEAGSNHMLVVRGGERFDVVEVIDVEEALSYRIDGHGHDMLHWCLPGVPDWLIAVLFRFVLVDE